MPETLAAMTAAQLFFVAVSAVMMAINVFKAVAASTSSSSRKDDPYDSRGQQINTTSSTRPLPLIYGRTRVGINRVYIGTSGTDSKYLHIIGAVCEGPINGIAQTGGVDQLFLNEKLYTEYGSHVYYEFFTGTSTQAVCATLHTAIPEWNDPLRYTAYIYIRLEFDQDVFQSLPEITMEIEGLKVYDPHDASTAYSRNPALCARDFMTRSSRRGGMGYGATRISDTTITDSATYCDTKGWTCNLALIDNQSAVDNFQHILNCFRGDLLYADTVFKLKYRDLNYESNVMALTEDDVVESGASTLKISQPSIFNTPNAVVCRYPNIEKNYQIDDFVFADSAAIAADGDYREQAVNLYGVSSLMNVQKMANYFLERFRINKTASLVMGSRGMALEPLDLITLTHSRPGWTAKQLRVEGVQVNYNGEVALALQEEDADFYNDIYDVESHAWHDTNLPDPSATVTGVINVSNTEEVYNYRGRSFTRWKVNFDPPAASTYPFWDYADIYLKVGAGDWKFMTKSGGDYQVDPVEEGVTYYCCIVSVSIFGTKQAFGDGYIASKTIDGQGDNPGNVTNFAVTAAGNVVTFNADEVTDADVIGYEIRMGASWAGGSFIGFNLSPKLRASYIAPGAQTFWIAAKNNAGLYSATPASAACTVPYPSSYDYKTDWEWDYSTGTHSNTEQVTHDAILQLKCSHTAAVLTGTWQSATYDFGSVKRAKIYGDFIHQFHAGSKTWAGIFPTTWAANAAKTWQQVLVDDYTGTLSAKLHYGEAAWDEHSVDNFDSLAPEIDARYIRVEITLTDPEGDANMYNAALNMTALTYV